MMYDLVAIDPPWTWSSWGKNGDGRSASRHYGLMSMADLYDVQPGRIMEKDSTLLLWVIDSMIPQALDLLKAWNFKYKTVGFYWTKRTKHGKPHIGTGYYSRANPEQCWIATRGKGIPRASRSVRRWIDAPIGRHSEKPGEFYTRAEQLFGDVRRLDIFGRQGRDNWTVAGDEIDGLDIREWISQQTLDTGSARA